MESGTNTEPSERNRLRLGEIGDLAQGSWRRTSRFDRKWNADYWSVGHPSRLQHGSFAITPWT